MSAKNRLASFLAARRNNPVVRMVDRSAVSFHRAVSNLNYDMHLNGESRVLSMCRDAQVVFDVGANDGSWATMAAEAAPDCRVWAFEIVPETFEVLAATVAREPRIQAVRSGLGDVAGDLEVYCAPGNSGVSTCLPGMSTQLHGDAVQVVVAGVVTGDTFCATEGIEHIDVLKIDVEGFEPQVLAGFAGMLGRGDIDVVQFEYGLANAGSGFLLRDFHELFDGYGMVVGKVFPRSVEFGPYRVTDEDFIGPNYVAVRRELVGRLEMLRGG